ncbi:hypothetical protein BpHYR1_011829 [Brachionus plicatilis]|uniref:Uncharacterized protein n=1 Tax=Brachionus plicatilis TaxID=10195 RepID=A0A3M7RW07_BRAPC|nr:hypothetical protein BpHYR1_011829 [Brachionus plicatilis]
MIYLTSINFIISVLLTIKPFKKIVIKQRLNYFFILLKTDRFRLYEAFLRVSLIKYKKNLENQYVKNQYFLAIIHGKFHVTHII